ncbi:lipase [Skermania sp. ID1734]|nr:lipase family protein [Skermania sp. ID1734]TSD99188.1 lipase [Skermania sp. ID1734]
MGERRFVVGLLVLLFALATALTGQARAKAQPVMPAADPDAWYLAPADIGNYKPGDVIRFRQMPWNLYFPTSEVWEILFRTNDSEGKPIAANTTFILPPNHAPDGPLVSYQHIINALGQKCKLISELYATDLTTQIREAPGLNIALLRGWAVALPDHLGPRMAYGAAKLGGQITLDGIRAVQKLPQLKVMHSPIGMAGYSGGGMATAWAAALAPTYAPELNIIGAVEGGVPMNLVTMAKVLGPNRHVAFGLALAAAIGLEREYPDKVDLTDQLNGTGRFLEDRVANECTNLIMFWGLFHSAPELTDNRDFMDNPAAWEVLRENSLEFYSGVPKAPIFEWHSPIDGLIPVDAIDNTLHRYCRDGVRVESILTPTPDHLSAAVLGFPAALDWMEARFRGEPAPSNCATL